MPFDRSRLPDPVSFFEHEGVKLTGPGKWKTGPCLEHGGSDSLRVHVESGAHVCMSCGVKGGDILAFQMRRHGMDFVDACKVLGAWVEGDKANRHRQHSLPFSALPALEVVKFEALLVAMAACNLAKGVQLASADRDRLVQAAGRIQFIAQEIGK